MIRKIVIRRMLINLEIGGIRKEINTILREIKIMTITGCVPPQNRVKGKESSSIDP